MPAVMPAIAWSWNKIVPRMFTFFCREIPMWFRWNIFWPPYYLYIFAKSISSLCFSLQSGHTMLIWGATMNLSRPEYLEIHSSAPISYFASFGKKNHEILFFMMIEFLKILAKIFKMNKWWYILKSIQHLKLVFLTFWIIQEQSF